MGKYALKRNHHAYKAETHYQPNGEQWRYRSPIRRGIRSNRAVVQMHNAGALRSHFRHLSIYGPTSLPHLPRFHDGRTYFVKYLRNYHCALSYCFLVWTRSNFNPMKLHTRYCFSTSIEVYDNVEILGIMQHKLLC